MENGINIWSRLCVRTHAAWFIYCGVTCRLSQMPLSGRSSPCSTRAVSASSLQTTKNVISQLKPRWNKDKTFPLQILSGIRPDSPFASIPVSTLCEPLWCTRCVILSVCNLWSDCDVSQRGSLWRMRMFCSICLLGPRRPFISGTWEPRSAGSQWVQTRTVHQRGWQWSTSSHDSPHTVHPITSTAIFSVCPG